MNKLLLNQDFCVRLSASLGHFLWQGVLLWIVAVLVKRGLSRRSASTRYVLYVSLFVFMVLCVPLSFLLLTKARPIAYPLANSRLASIAASAEGGTAAGSRSAFADDPWQRARSPIATAYIVGLAVMLVRLWLRLSGGKSISGRSEAIENTDVLLALARAVKRMQFAYTPGIAYSARAAVPCVVGILKPMLILPFSAATSLTPEQLELVVMHELAHVRRYDHVVSLIQRLGESMLFFHPAVWYLSRLIEQERELCCDEAVVRAGGVAEDYAELLMRISKATASAIAAGPFAFALTGQKPSELGRRVRWLVGLDDPSRVRLTRHSSAMVSVLFLGIAFSFAFLSVRVVPAHLIPPPQEQIGGSGSLERLSMTGHRAEVLGDWSRLHFVVDKGTLKEVQVLLLNNANPNIRTAQGWTPLHFAACLDRDDVVRTLLEAGGDPNAENADGRTPLLSAMGVASPLSLTGRPTAQRAMLVLLDAGANVNRADKEGISPLHAAVMRRDVVAAAEIIRRGGNVNAGDASKRPPLHWACDRCDLPMIGLLLRSGADVRQIDDKSWAAMQHLTFRMPATDRDSLRAAAGELETQGAALDLCSAVVLGDAPAVHRYLDKDPSLVNALPAVTRYEWRLIHWAASAGEAAMVETLLSYGADPNARASDGRTALHVAAGLGRTSVPIVSRLIGAGADVNLLDKGGRSPLHIAAGQLDAGSISALISAGAKVNVTDATQRTPLVIAVTVGSSVGANAAAIDTLILNGADVNLADQSGRTPLHYVCAAGRIDLAEVLLQVGGIDVNKKDNSGMTPMSLAVGSKSGGDRLVRLLVNHGASPTFAKSR